MCISESLTSHLIQIFEYAVSLPDPISVVECDVICYSCGVHADPTISGIKNKFINCYGALHTSRAFRLEAFNAFIRVNTWRLEHTQFHDAEIPAPLYIDTPPDIPGAEERQPVLTASLDQLVCGEHLAQDIKHFYLHAQLCARGILEAKGRLPAEFDKTNHAAARRWLMTQIVEPGQSGWTRVSEQTLSDEHSNYLTNLVNAQRAGSCRPRTLTIDLVIHEVNDDPEKRHLDQCGLRLLIEVRFREFEISTEPSSHDTVASSRPLKSYQSFEPKRNLLLPLLDLHNIQRINVRRNWTLKTMPEPVKKSVDVVELGEVVRPLTEIPMVQDFQYRTAQEFFDAVGKDLMELRRTGVVEAGLKVSDVVSIQENTQPVDGAIPLIQPWVERPDPLQAFGNDWSTG